MKDLKKFIMRIGDIEVHTCNISLLSEPPHVTMEIIKDINQGKTNYTIAYWKKDKEGFDLAFVGDRPFECDPLDFFNLAKTGQSILDKYFEEE